MTATLERVDRRVLILAALGLAVLLVLLLVPDAFAAPIGAADVGKNTGDLLKKYAGQLYVGIIAIVGLIFLINKAYSQLGVFLIAALAVGMLVVAPEAFKGFAKDTADALFK